MGRANKYKTKYNTKYITKYKIKYKIKYRNKKSIHNIFQFFEALLKNFPISSNSLKNTMAQLHSVEPYAHSVRIAIWQLKKELALSVDLTCRH